MPVRRASVTPKVITWANSWAVDRAVELTVTPKIDTTRSGQHQDPIGRTQLHKMIGEEEARMLRTYEGRDRDEDRNHGKHNSSPRAFLLSRGGTCTLNSLLNIEKGRSVLSASQIFAKGARARAAPRSRTFTPAGISQVVQSSSSAPFTVTACSLLLAMRHEQPSDGGQSNEPALPCRNLPNRETFRGTVPKREELLPALCKCFLG